MTQRPSALTRTFQRFFDSEKSAGALLLACTALSLLLANSPWGGDYLALWQIKLGPLSIAHWVNDAGMAIFFLLIGLELERELYSGELSSPQKALLPVVAALGGAATPALIHYLFNHGTPTAAGFGIPMATDIAFAVGALAILGRRVPASLKVFVVAFAVMDDLLAIVIIAIFYTAEISGVYLGGALAVLALLCGLNRIFRVMGLAPYLAGGLVIWFLFLKSGVHATLAGVLLAFAIPFSAQDDDSHSPSHRLEHHLHKPVAFVILPLFALANTALVVGADWLQILGNPNSWGIVAGLVLGKPIGLTLFCWVAVWLGICSLPDSLNWRHVFGAGLLGGIGFTMSIFIANLSYAEQGALLNASKIAILLASTLAGGLGLVWLAAYGAEKRPGGLAQD
jgi:Na+:H+ antiporter, NhaA family